MKNKGITLIALVITIIVLLILAGVTINTLLGEGGVIKQSQDAKDTSEISQERESLLLAYDSIQMEKIDYADKTFTAAEYEEAIKEYEEGVQITTEEGKTVVTFPNGHKYIVNTNGTMLSINPPTYAKNGLTLIENGSNIESPYVNYPSALGNIKCKVLYNDSAYGLQLVSMQLVESVVLGKNDPCENVEGEMGSLERTQNSYNRLIMTLNEKTEKYKETVSGDELAIDTRCIGSNPVPGGKNHPDDLTGEERQAAMYTADSSYTWLSEYNGKYFDTVSYKSIDRLRLSKMKALRIDERGSGYFFATRKVNLFDDHGNCCFSVTEQSTNENTYPMWQVNSDGVVKYWDTTRGLRPVFILNPNVKVISGEGTEENPYEIGL